MTNNDYILKSEFRKMIEKMETYIEQSVEHEWIDKSDLLSELDKLPTISPVEIIEEMIEEIKNGIDPGHVTMLSARATLEELDKLPSGWIPVTDKYSYREYCEYPHSNSEYEIYFGKREVYDIDDWRNMMVIKAHSYHHDDLPLHP